MNMRMLGTVVTLLAASVGFAEEPLIQNLSVRQRWPWSNKVDIDYVYTGTCPTTVVFTATWNGQSEPVDLLSIGSVGVGNVQPGQNRFEWDPTAAGYGRQTLVNFQVQATLAKSDPRTYLVVDLVNGGYTFLADVPTGGWTDEYKTTKMVFRRIPSGTYHLGYDHTKFYDITGSGENGTTRPIAQGGALRDVTLTSDFYFQVFLWTTAHAQVLAGYSNGNAVPVNCFDKYATLRGEVADDGTTAINWPSTGYLVNSQSLVGRLRQKVGGSLLVDLPTDAQWEIAMRAGTTTFWPNGEPTGGTYDFAQWRALQKALFWNLANKGFPAEAEGETGDGNPWDYAVGLKSCNAFGIYDFNVRQVPVLDWANDKEALNSINKPNLDFPEGGTDPVGPTSSIHNVRVLRGGSAGGATWCMYNYALTQRSSQDVDVSMACNLRFAIHLKPLVP